MQRERDSSEILKAGYGHSHKMVVMVAMVSYKRAGNQKQTKHWVAANYLLMPLESMWHPEELLEMQVCLKLVFSFSF